MEEAIEDTICTLRDLIVMVAAIHGDSKWNPIDHGLFSQVRKNLAGEPSSTRHSSSSVPPNALRLHRQCPPHLGELNYDTESKSRTRNFLANPVPNDVSGRWTHHGGPLFRMRTIPLTPADAPFEERNRGLALSKGSLFNA